ncbi:hypothetical protein Pla52o_08750 [Novipirellula galeiformis]|uniref:Uncharacterized protein n=1 Tax=Novipirellula galeiformis TaxID=2528004 RepID=A0A5C6CRL2_9BACT|nr:hypothetical protein [Novipirellula galeiformis]TWU27018.1 hypothetical protein Pla52o_08750 [Novipirellula galeiformis]
MKSASATASHEIVGAGLLEASVAPSTRVIAEAIYGGYDPRFARRRKLSLRWDRVPLNPRAEIAQCFEPNIDVRHIWMD